MAPNSTIIITRHSQATHNVADDYSIPDAALTEKGKVQAARLASMIPNDVAESVDLIVSSPLKRTLQTTLSGWGPTVERLGGRSSIIVLPQLQECNAYPCDTGSSRETLEADPELQGLDLSLLTPDWTSKQGQFAADEKTLNARAQWVRQFLRSRPEKTIAIVGHGDIIRRITASPQGNSTYMWKNAEVRSYEFLPDWVEKDECFLTREGLEVVAGGYEPTSSEMTAGGGSSSTGVLAELQDKIAEKQESVQTKARELDELEERLKKAEARKQELEAKGVKLP